MVQGQETRAHREDPRTTGRQAGQRLKKRLKVGLFAEDFLAMVAVVDDVIDETIGDRSPGAERAAG
jgi:hypothetical protein